MMVGNNNYLANSLFEWLNLLLLLSVAVQFLLFIIIVII
jgi:hypothetical protein